MTLYKYLYLMDSRLHFVRLHRNFTCQKSRSFYETSFDMSVNKDLKAMFISQLFSQQDGV